MERERRWPVPFIRYMFAYRKSYTNAIQDHKFPLWIQQAPEKQSSHMFTVPICLMDGEACFSA